MLVKRQAEREKQVAEAARELERIEAEKAAKELAIRQKEEAILEQ